MNDLTKPIVGVDFERIKYPFSGLGQVCTQLLLAFEKNHNQRFLLQGYAPKKFLKSQHNLSRSYQSVSMLHKIFGVPSEYLSVWHSTHQDSHFWPRNKKTRVVLTVHDLNFLSEKNSEKSAARLQRLQKRIDQAAVVTAISHFTANEVKRNLNVQGEVLVIPNGAQPSGFQDTPLKPAIVPKSPFLFAVGVMMEKKNFSTLIEMLEYLPEYHLVIGGGPENTYFQSLQNLVREKKLAHRVMLTGFLEPQVRNWYYQKCSACLVPSKLEGFGLPVVESLFFHRPVICSQLSSLPEVGGSLAFYWENFQPQAMAAQVRQAIEFVRINPADYSARCEKWIEQFRWESVAQQYLKVYESLL